MYAFVTAAALALLGADPSPPPPKGAAAAPALPADTTPFPSDAECKPLPALKTPIAFKPGEQLEFDLDALGASAGKLLLRVLPQKDGTLPIEVKPQTNTFFAKVRRVTGTGTSFLNPKTLRPVRYVEDVTENDVNKTAEVQFSAKDHNVHVDYKTNDKPGKLDLRYGNEALDVVGATYLVRQLPLAQGARFCFDAYGIRRLWRVVGKVEGREHVSLPVGEFDAWHLAGVSVRTDDHKQRREVHLWISDDDRRLPLVVVGVIDIGVVRATLSAFDRPGDKRARADGAENMKW